MTKNWLALIHASGIGPIKAQKLLAAFNNNAEAIFNASPATLQAVGLQNKELAGILKPNWEAVSNDLEWLEHPEHHLITLHDERYPTILKEIADPPLVLFVEGDPKILATPQLGIVGSRNPSHTGLDNAHDFAKYLAQTGLTITSGFALGIDTQSHKGALDANGKTIAVLGTGLNQIYPARNKALVKQIIATGGALVSELPINITAKPENFPRRNRIISGLSTGVLVIEATIRSGSLITARMANEQGREVFAIPGSIHNPLARGCHQLIRQGAKLVETAQDVLEELGSLVAVTTATEKPVIKNNLDKEYKNLLECVGYEATPIDILVTKTGFAASKVSAMLLNLELQNYVKNVSGGYIKNG